MPRVAAQRPGGYHLALIHSVFGPNSPVAMGRLAKSEGPASHVIPDGPPLAAGRCRERRPAEHDDQTTDSKLIFWGSY